jgi:hypothetical protein
MSKNMNVYIPGTQTLFNTGEHMLMKVKNLEKFYADRPRIVTNNDPYTTKNLRQDEVNIISWGLGTCLEASLAAIAQYREIMEEHGKPDNIRAEIAKTIKGNFPGTTGVLNLMLTGQKVSPQQAKIWSDSHGFEFAMKEVQKSHTQYVKKGLKEEMVQQVSTLFKLLTFYLQKNRNKRENGMYQHDKVQNNESDDGVSQEDEDMGEQDPAKEFGEISERGSNTNPNGSGLNPPKGLGSNSQ